MSDNECRYSSSSQSKIGKKLKDLLFLQDEQVIVEFIIGAFEMILEKEGKQNKTKNKTKTGGTRGIVVILVKESKAFGSVLVV